MNSSPAKNLFRKIDDEFTYFLRKFTREEISPVIDFLEVTINKYNRNPAAVYEYFCNIPGIDNNNIINQRIDEFSPLSFNTLSSPISSHASSNLNQKNNNTSSQMRLKEVESQNNSINGHTQLLNGNNNNNNNGNTLVNKRKRGRSDFFQYTSQNKLSSNNNNNTTSILNNTNSRLTSSNSAQLQPPTMSSNADIAKMNNNNNYGDYSESEMDDMAININSNNRSGVLHIANDSLSENNDDNESTFSSFEDNKEAVKEVINNGNTNGSGMWLVDKIENNKINNIDECGGGVGVGGEEEEDYEESNGLEYSNSNNGDAQFVMNNNRPLCCICNFKIATGKYYSSTNSSCRMCAKFFIRNVKLSLVCVADNNCDVSHIGKKCRKCRVMKCIASGMKEPR